VKKIIFINDPVAGFIRLDREIILSIVNHPYIQRLRRIKQLGLTDMVFPGATHTRFQHTLGAFQLMNDVLHHLKLKGVDVSTDEEDAVLAAILLHDIGHGPFSHALEEEIVDQVSHEQISLHFMHHLNKVTGNKLNLAIDIFQNNYHKEFLHQLLSGQLDVDRLDYLRRDSFFTGVTEGMVGSERLIRMMNVSNNKLVIEKKGVFTVENFLLARRSMYWQVYLHKTVIAAEYLLIKTLQRAKYLARNKQELFASPSLHFFLYNEFKVECFDDIEVLNNFALLDDNDILNAIKVWTNHSDKILSILSKNLINRVTPHIEISATPFQGDYIHNMQKKICIDFKIDLSDSEYFAFTGSVENTLYNLSHEKILILNGRNEVIEYKASETGIHLINYSEPVQRYFFCYPKYLKNS